jgi:hypothetical protein
MDRGWGMALIAGGAVLSVACAAVLHRRAWPWIVYSLAAVGGATAGSGALLIQSRDAGPGDWLVTLATLGVLVPAHIRVVFGPARRE